MTATKPIKVVWLSRAQAGLPPAPPMKARGVPILGTTVHHTATKDPDRDPAATWRQINHEAISGGLADRYTDIPYNAGACKLADGVGAILGGRPNDVIGAHARPVPMHGHVEPPNWADVANLYTLGLAIIGTDPTPEAQAAVNAYLWVANQGLHAPLVYTHSYWDPTECPGLAEVFRLGALNSKFVHLTSK